MLACRSDAAERPWSVQLHVHGSFSEGLGSIDSHDHEASSVGCDVVWWSDHDFRVLTYEHVTRFGFEGWEEPLERGEPWSVRLAKFQGDKKGVKLLGRRPGATARFVDEPVHEGAKSLRLTAEGAGAEFESQLVALGAERKLQQRSLATGVTLRLALLPEALGPDARALVEVQLSEHAPREGLGLVPSSVRYVIAPEAGPPRREGAVYVVPVACELGRWNELVLPLTADAVRGFPLYPGEDNALTEIAFGVEARAGARAAACFDDLCIEQALTGPPVFARQGELIGEVGALYPGLAQLQGLEISYGSRHLNLFCRATPLPDYDAIAARTPADPERPGFLDPRAFRDAVVEGIVAETHARGGLVSYNHPFGVEFEERERPRTNEQQLEILLANRAEGADLLEVGYRSRGGATLDDHLFLWDQAALRGLRLVGVGTSDSHGGPENRWRGQPNNFVSWVWSTRPDAEGLIEGLRAGRVFFGDIERFDGELDLAAEGAHMGATVVTHAAALEVELVARGVTAGERIVVVESGARTKTYEVGGTEFTVKHELKLEGAGPAFVRFELHDGTGPIALTNPIYFVRE